MSSISPSAWGNAPLAHPLESSIGRLSDRSTANPASHVLRRHLARKLSNPSPLALGRGLSAKGPTADSDVQVSLVLT